MRGRLECEEADIASAFEDMELIAHHRLTLSATVRIGGRVSVNVVESCTKQVFRWMACCRGHIGIFHEE